jgi:hypothetical protein
MWKQLVFSVVFASLLLVLDGSSKASQAWEGAPPCYLPVGREKDLAEAPAMVKCLEAEVGSLMEAVRRDVRGDSAARTATRTPHSRLGDAGIDGPEICIGYAPARGRPTSIYCWGRPVIRALTLWLGVRLGPMTI